MAYSLVYFVIPNQFFVFCVVCCFSEDPTLCYLYLKIYLSLNTLIAQILPGQKCTESLTPVLCFLLSIHDPAEGHRLN